MAPELKNATNPFVAVAAKPVAPTLLIRARSTLTKAFATNAELVTIPPAPVAMIDAPVEFRVT